MTAHGPVAAATPVPATAAAAAAVAAAATRADLPPRGEQYAAASACPSGIPRGSVILSRPEWSPVPRQWSRPGPAGKEDGTGSLIPTQFYRSIS